MGIINASVQADARAAIQAFRQLDSTLGQLDKSQKDVSSSAKKAGSAFDDLAGSAKGAVAAFGVMGVLKVSTELVQLGASANAARGALNALSGGNAQSYITAIGDATRGTVSEIEAMQIASKLLGMQIVDTAQEAGDFTRVAAILGAQFRGLGAREAAEEFSIMLANMSTLRLDTFGISSAAVRAEMERLKATVPGISDEMAFYQATMSEAAPLADTLSGALENQQSSIARLTAWVDDQKAALGQWLADGIMPIIDGAQRMAAAGDDMMLSMARQSTTVDELAQTFMTAEGAQRTFIDNQRAAVFSAAMARGEMLTYEEAIHRLAQEQYAAAWAAEDNNEIMRRQAAATADATPVVERHTVSAEEAAKAYDEWKRAAEQLYRQQTSLASLVEDFGGQIGNIGVTVLRTTGANADMAEATAMLNDQISQTSADLREAQVAALAMGDDGTGPLGAKVQELSGYLGHLQNRLNDVSGAAGGTTSSMQILALTEEESKQVGESFLSFMRATGNEALMAGQAFDDLRLRYGLVEPAQVALENSLETLGGSLSAHNITVEQAADIYERLVTGQLASADAAVIQAEQINIVAETFGLSTEKAQGFLEAAAQSYGIDPYAGAALGAENATDPAAALAEKTSEINQALGGIAVAAAPAMVAMSENAPPAISQMSILAMRTEATEKSLKWMMTHSAAVFEEMNAAAAPVVAEGAPLARANALVAQMRAAWSYLLANPTLSLNVYLSQIGSVQGASVGGGSGGGASGVQAGLAGGGAFYTSGPTTIRVGDNPGGVEYVSVTPVSGVGTTWYNTGSIAMAGGGEVVAAAPSSTVINQTFYVTAQSFNDIVSEAERQGLQFQKKN